MGGSLSLLTAPIVSVRLTSAVGSDDKNWLPYRDRMLGELDPLVDVEHYRKSG